MLLLAHSRPRAISGPFFALVLILLFILLAFFAWWFKIRQDEHERMRDVEAAQASPPPVKEPETEEEMKLDAIKMEA